MATRRERWLIFRLAAPIGDHRAQVTEAMVGAALPARSQVVGTVALDLAQERVESINLASAAQRLQAKVDELKQASEQLNASKIGVFAIGPIPLLARLGRLLGQDERIEVFQRLRPPTEGWAWQPEAQPGTDLHFPPSTLDRSTAKVIAVVLAISTDVQDEDVRAALPGISPKIYRVTSGRHDSNVISTRAQLVDFQVRYERLIRAIDSAHGGDVRLHLFAGVPVSIAVEAGRWPLQKSFASFHVYEWHHGRFERGLDMFSPRPTAIEAKAPVSFVPITTSGQLGSVARREQGWDHPAHHASVAGLVASETPITVADWDSVRRARPEDGLDPCGSCEDPSAPVVNVGWLEALRFANALSCLDGRTPAFEFLPGGGVRHTGGDGFRLPLETEWELMALGNGIPGSQGPFVEERLGRPALVRTSTPNGLRLYDMVGNIWEWCLDAWDPGAYGPRERGVKVDVAGARLLRTDQAVAQDLRLQDPTCARVVRGGGVDVQRELVDAQTRSFAFPEGNRCLGFRLVGPARKDAAPQKPPAQPAAVPLQPSSAGGASYMSVYNIQGTNVQFVQSGTGIQNNSTSSRQDDLVARLDDLLALVCSGRAEGEALRSRLAVLEQDLMAFGGGVADLRDMIEPLWKKHVTETNRTMIEGFARGLPDKAIWLILSQAVLRLIAS